MHAYIHTYIHPTLKIRLGDKLGLRVRSHTPICRSPLQVWDHVDPTASYELRAIKVLQCKVFQGFGSVGFIKLTSNLAGNGTDTS